MELEKLKKYKQVYKDFSSKIDSLVAFFAKSFADQRKYLITPHEVSDVVGINEMEALFLLSLAEKEHIVSRKFFVFTDEDNTPLGEYDSTQSIPESITNPGTGKEVDRDHYYVELSFELEK